MFLVDDAKVSKDPGEIVGVQVGVLCTSAPSLLVFLELALELLAGDFHHDLPEHLDEPAIGIESEAQVAARLPGKAVHRFVVKAQV